MGKLFLIDAGHGRLDPKTGIYVTAGKRSPKDEDGNVLYEGVNNAINAELIVEGLQEKGLKAEMLLDTWRDVPLPLRCEMVNSRHKDEDVVLISIHSDAYGDGSEWTDPKGVTVFTSKGDTPADPYATFLFKELQCNLDGLTTMRSDYFRDGDPDKESQFYILVHTNCPAILLELGFHTNKEEVKLMQTLEWRQKIVKSVVDACLLINDR